MLSEVLPFTLLPVPMDTISGKKTRIQAAS